MNDYGFTPEQQRLHEQALEAWEDMQRAFALKALHLAELRTALGEEKYQRILATGVLGND